jgi:hypothetical protein
MDKNQDAEFMIESYRDSTQNVMHIEKELFNHVSFFLTIFIGVLTASIAILQLTREPDQPISMTETIGIFSLPFLFSWLVGQFEVQMIMQLRVRKIKFIEALIKVREYFIKQSPELSTYIVMPAKSEKAPPYLRVRSDDWYKLLFVISLNTVSLFLVWIGFPPLIGLLFKGYVSFGASNNVLNILLSCLQFLWIVAGLIFCIFVYWLSSYQRIMNYFSSFDQRREYQIGKPSEYDLLEIPISNSWHKRSLSDWFILLERQRFKNDKTS